MFQVLVLGTAMAFSPAGIEHGAHVGNQAIYQASYFSKALKHRWLPNPIPPVHLGPVTVTLPSPISPVPRLPSITVHSGGIIAKIINGTDAVVQAPSNLGEKVIASPLVALGHGIVAPFDRLRDQGRQLVKDVRGWLDRIVAEAIHWGGIAVALFFVVLFTVVGSATFLGAIAAVLLLRRLARKMGRPSHPARPSAF